MPNNGQPQGSGIPSPKRQHFETVNQVFQDFNDPQQTLQQSLNPLIKDYKLKPIYELENNTKYRQMMQNGSTHYRSNFDNRNKVIWNNTDFRLFNRDNPHSMEILRVEGTDQKPVRDKRRLIGFENRMPEQDPEVKNKFNNDNNLYNTLNFKRGSLSNDDPLPHSTYTDLHGSIRANRNQQNIEVNRGSQRRADEILREQAEIRDTFLTVGPSQRFNSVVSKSYKESPFKSLNNPDPNKPLTSNIASVHFQNPNPTLQQPNPEFNQQQVNYNNQLNSYMNVTSKHLDTSGRRPPSKHYQIDQNTQKIYSTLYPEPGYTQKQQLNFKNSQNQFQNMPHTTVNSQGQNNQPTFDPSQNKLIQNYEKQNQYSHNLADYPQQQQQQINNGSNLISNELRPSYGSLIGLSRRIDMGIKEKQYMGDTFSQDKKYFDKIMQENSQSMRQQRMSLNDRQQQYNSTTMLNTGINILQS